MNRYVTDSKTQRDRRDFTKLLETLNTRSLVFLLAVSRYAEASIYDDTVLTFIGRTVGDMT